MGTPPSVIIAIPGCPPSCLSINSRKHWTVVSNARKKAKTEGWACALHALNGKPTPFKKPVDLLVVIRWGKYRRIMDRDNVYSMTKPYLDGMIRAGVLPDDSPKYIASYVIEQSRDPGGSGEMVFEFTETT